MQIVKGMYDLKQSPKACFGRFGKAIGNQKFRKRLRGEGR